MMRRATLLLVSTFAVAFLFLSCDSNLNQDNPNQLTTSNYYQNGAQLETGVNAIYANLNTTGMYKRRKFFAYDALAGVMEEGGGQTEQWIPNMIDWNHGDGSNNGMRLHWVGLYQGVKRANLVIENGPNVTEGITDELRNRLMGEAYFMRAFYYDKLMALWGESGDTNRGVPLLMEPSETVGEVPLADPQRVDSLIIADLETAISSLPWSYSDNINVGRATATAAVAVKGRAHLRMGEWQAAHDALLRVVNEGETPNGGDLRLVDNYFDNFKEETENNAESIFEVQHAEAGSGNHWSVQGGNGTTRSFRNTEYGFRQWRNVVASRDVLNEMDVPQSSFPGPGPETSAQVSQVPDPRATSTFYFACDEYNAGASIYTTGLNPASSCPGGGRGYTVPEQEDNRPSWKKYQVYYRENLSGAPANSGINMRDFRYAEVLLGLAEAKLMGASGGSMSATQRINQVRSRVGLSGIGSADMPALRHEFVLEFTGDPALLMFLQRHPGQLREFNSKAPNSGPVYQPIPLEEIDNNPAISSDVNADLQY